MNINSIIKNIEFKCIYNASGPRCTTSEDLNKLDNSSSGAILTKSCTLKSREGNKKPRYFENKYGSINSMGLPNFGVDFYIKESINRTKPYFISICGLSKNENLELLKCIFKNVINITNINGIEINLSCPNIIGKGQLAYDFDELKLYLEEIFNLINKYKDDYSYLEQFPLIGIKLPPYFELSHFEMVSLILTKYDIDFITCINSIGNGLLIDVNTESVCIKPKDGIGGIGGIYAKPTGLSNVYNFYKQFKKFNSDIKIIGCGGIKSGTDAFEYILCGAEAVQIGTQFYSEDIKCFKRIEDELIDIMKLKNYTNINDFKGKLKTID